MTSSGLRVFAGLALALGGAILVLLAADVHGGTARKEVLAEASAHRPICPEPKCNCPPQKPCPTAAPPPPPAVSSAPPAGSASAAPAQGNGFRFGKGGIILEKSELQRLIGLANELKRTSGKVVLEGFGDEPGTDDKTLGLGRRRATLARQLLAEIGFDGERLVVAAKNVADNPAAAGTVVVREETK